MKTLLRKLEKLQKKRTRYLFFRRFSQVFKNFRNIFSQTTDKFPLAITARSFFIPPLQKKKETSANLQFSNVFRFLDIFKGYKKRKPGGNWLIICYLTCVRYNFVYSFRSQLFLMGTKSIHMSN